MKKYRVFTNLICVALCFIFLCSCTQKATLDLPGSYALPDKLLSVKSAIIAENSQISLGWDLEKYCVTLTDKQDDTVWSTTPYEYYTSGIKESGFRADGLCSTVRVTYLDSKNNTESEVNSNSDADYITAKKSDKGLQLTYYFDKIKISVPVSFILEEDGISVSIEVSGITEDANHIISVALLPFFVSAQNNDVSYLFVPSGSGALMYTDDNAREARNYSEPVYGNDASGQEIYQNTEAESIRMPVFGACNKENSIFAVITNGAETAEIKATAGDSQYGYSAVYPVFNLRGKASSLVKGSANTSNNIIKYSDDIVEYNRMTVKYILCPSDESGYNGFAKLYRRYLSENEGLKSNIQNEDAFITVFGGIKEKQLMLGIPYYALEACTTLNQANDILSDIKKNTDADIAVNLKGFGNSGLDYGQIGGGFVLGSPFGSVKDLQKLYSWADKNDIDTFFDLDMIHQKKSGNGFNVKNAAMTANGVRARYCDYQIVTREQSDNVYAFLANRSALAQFGNQLISKVRQLGISGIGLSALSGVAYSDYDSAAYYCKGHISDDVIRILETAEKNGIKTCGEQANSYAASRLDYVTNAPVQSSKYSSLDRDIPFYQMVFKGAVGLSGKAINLSHDPRFAFLKAVSTGSALSFSVCSNVSNGAIMSDHSALGASVYKDIQEKMFQYLDEASPLLKKVKDTTIEAFYYDGEVTQTVFKNGVQVYVNFGDTAVITEIGEIAPKSYDYR